MHDCARVLTVRTLSDPPSHTCTVTYPSLGDVHARCLSLRKCMHTRALCTPALAAPVVCLLLHRTLSLVAARVLE
jgi:hypothetical protein